MSQPGDAGARMTCAAQRHGGQQEQGGRPRRRMRCITGAQPGPGTREGPSRAKQSRGRSGLLGKCSLGCYGAVKAQIAGMPPPSAGLIRACRSRGSSATASYVTLCNRMTGSRDHAFLSGTGRRPPSRAVLRRCPWSWCRPAGGRHWSAADIGARSALTFSVRSAPGGNLPTRGVSRREEPSSDAGRVVR